MSRPLWRRPRVGDSREGGFGHWYGQLQLQAFTLSMRRDMQAVLFFFRQKAIEHTTNGDYICQSVLRTLWNLLSIVADAAVGTVSSTLFNGIIDLQSVQSSTSRGFDLILIWFVLVL